MYAIDRVSFRRSLLGFALALPMVTTIVNVTSPCASGQNTAKTVDQPGQKFLDEATDLKIEAKTPDELSKIIDLAEKAIATGLDEDGKTFAKQIIATTAFQKAQTTLEQLIQSRTRNPATLSRLRTIVRRDLKKAIEADANMADAYLLLAQIDEPAEAKGNLDKAIALLKDDPAKLAKAYMLQGSMAQDIDEKTKAFRKASETDPSNLEARQALIAIQVADGKFDEAYQESKRLLDKEPKSIFAIKAAVAALKELDRVDEAIELLNTKVTDFTDGAPETFVLLQDRADLYIEKQNASESKDDADATPFLDKAIADLNKVIEADPKNGQALMTRTRVYLQKKEFGKAEQDIEDVLAIQPNQPGALYFRSLVAANQKRLGDAIADLQQVVRLVPNNGEFLLQLGSYYQMDDRPKKAIQVADEVIKSGNEEWSHLQTRALRLRGDAELSIGAHKEAIADFEKAISLLSDEDTDEKSGLLNNLAWVLSTSPVDAIRDGKRAVELGTKACELTKFKAAHILSTLAAGYAEVGNFDEATKWAEKAVEEGKREDSEQLKQLQEELDSYKQKKPWREKQDTKEKKAPIPSPDGVDT